MGWATINLIESLLGLYGINAQALGLWLDFVNATVIF